MTTTASEPFPVSADFPVSWPKPEFQALHWVWDQVHNPHPETPLTSTFEAPAFSEGSTRGFHALAMPLTYRAIVVNGYRFGAMDFEEETTGFPPAWWPRVEQEFLKRLPTLTKSWHEEFLPEVMAMNHRIRDYDYAGASVDELLAFIDEMAGMRRRSWDIHMQVVMPALGASGRFAEVYESVLGKPEGTEHYQMLGGYENKTVESGAALWQLRERALAEPAVAKVFESRPVSELPGALRASSADFWSAFERYLEDYGWRSDAFELADPAWIEDPSIPLAALRDMLGAPDDGDPLLSQQRAREERERLVAEAMERLDGQEGKPIFEMMLGIAQQYLPIQENHNFYIDQMNTVLLRRPFLALGDRLVDAGSIAARDDVFYLRYDELAGATSRDCTALVAERRAERKRQSAIVPPRELGTPLPEGVRNNPLAEGFFGKRPEQSHDPKVINGIAASAGTVTARARVVHSLSEAGKLEPGDVLVCQMTMPAWTPLFATVSAVVADSGGVLSHCAIVAREYGIPCVVGTETGTQTLRDGQRITVDGGKGVVRIESE